MLINRPVSKDKALIPPQTPYCYHVIDVDDKGHSATLLCPYWELRPDKPEQENGYCHYIQKGDWERGVISLIWDSVKECGENRDTEKYFRMVISHDKSIEKEHHDKIIQWAESVLPLIIDENYKEKVTVWIAKMRKELDE